MSTVERARDAIFQRVSDWTDARWGLGCFSLARSCMLVTAIVPTFCDLVASRVVGSDAVLWACLYEIPFDVGMMAVATYVGHAVRRRPTPSSRFLFPFREPSIVACAVLIVVSNAWICGIVGTHLWQVLATVGPNAPDARFDELMFVGMLLRWGWQFGLLFASCEWRRLPPVRRDVRVGRLARVA